MTERCIFLITWDKAPIYHFIGFLTADIPVQRNGTKQLAVKKNSNNKIGQVCNNIMGEYLTYSMERVFYYKIANIFYLIMEKTFLKLKKYISFVQN